MPDVGGQQRLHAGHRSGTQPGSKVRPCSHRLATILAAGESVSKGANALVYKVVVQYPLSSAKELAQCNFVPRAGEEFCPALDLWRRTTTTTGGILRDIDGVCSPKEIRPTAHAPAANAPYSPYTGWLRGLYYTETEINPMIIVRY